MSRRIQPPFLAGWDEFLQVLVSSARTRLEADWPNAWLSAPVWHFGLGAGLAGPAVHWGVIIPSLDRVGRLFPFSIIGEAAAGGRALRDWTLSAERLALDALEAGFDLKAFDVALRVLGQPELRADGGIGGEIVPLDDNDQDWPAQVEAAGAPAPGKSFWWRRSIGDRSGTMLACDGLDDRLSREGWLF